MKQKEKCRERKVSIDIYVCDASFDGVSKTATISSLWFGEKEIFKKNIGAESSLESEKKAIIETFRFAAARKQRHVLVINDNMYAVFGIRKELAQKRFMKSAFSSWQVVWLPREMTAAADFFTKRGTVEHLREKACEVERNLCFDMERKGEKIISLMLSEKEKREIVKKKIFSLIDERVKNVLSSPFFKGTGNEVLKEDVVLIAAENEAAGRLAASLFLKS